MGRSAQCVSRFFSLRKKKQNDWAFPEELCRRFTLAEIRAATQCFDQTLCIGKGGFGTVYKGRIKVDGDEDRIDIVAIKRFSGVSTRGMSAFRNEVQLLCQLRHPNLISLIGFCKANGERITVYDYMPNGSLSDYLLHPSNIKNKDAFPLAWKQRLKFCIGVARAIHYLHAGVKHAIIHRNVNCSSILLDQNLVLKLSGFGWSERGPPVLSNAVFILKSEVAGTIGYIAPECFYSTKGNVTEKSDVFSFGVVLLEVLCAKSYTNVLIGRPDSGKIFPDMIDPFLKGKVAPDCLKKFINITVRCLRLTGPERPTMGEVQVELEYALELQESTDAVKQLKELGTSEALLLLLLFLPMTWRTIPTKIYHFLRSMKFCVIVRECGSKGIRERGREIHLVLMRQLLLIALLALILLFFSIVLAIVLGSGFLVMFLISIHI